jgi:WD40 repeat protein
LAAAARESGRLEWALAVTTGRQPELLSDDEWRTTSTLLAGARRWARLWRLAMDAPPIWAAEMLRTLGSSGWQPDGEHEGFAALVRNAEDCAHHPVARVLDGWVGARRMVRALTVAPDGGLLIAGNDDGEIALWRLPSGEPVGRIDAIPAR